MIATKQTVIRCRLAIALCAAALIVAGTSIAGERPKLTDASFMEIDQLVVSAKGRPNEEARLRGLKSYQNGNDADAVAAFEHAALYADKFSQHYLSLLYLNGVGVQQDPVEAYIWSDLAAERGAKQLLAIREKMWARLTPAQQAQVELRGAEFYAKYGDDVAKPRAEAEIRRFARDMTGSRVGYRNQPLDISGPSVNGSFAADTGSNAAAYAISQHASPDELYGKEGGISRLTTYWQQQDRLLDGKVDVGPLEQVRDASKGPRKGG